MNVVRCGSNSNVRIAIESLGSNNIFTHELLGWANLLVAIPPVDYSHFVDVVLPCEDGVLAVCGAVVLGWETHASQ